MERTVALSLFCPVMLGDDLSDVIQLGFGGQEMNPGKSSEATEIYISGRGGRKG